MRRDVWITYRVRVADYDASGDQASAGGVHLHQVRRRPGGGWQKRICQSNGGRVSYSPVEPITATEGEAYFATAQSH